MKKLSLTLSLTCLVFICFSQVPPWQWAKRGGGNSIGSNSGAAPYDLVTDSAGNIYMTGFCDGNYMVIEQDTFYNAASWGGSDEIFIVKYSATGNLLWAKTYGGTDDETGYSITLDADGHLIAAGMFASTSIMFDTITLNNPLTGHN